MEALPLQAIVAVLNAWANADFDRIVATHAELSAQVLHRMPPVIPRRAQFEPLPPRRRYGEGPRAMRAKSDAHPEGWGREKE